MKKVIIKDTNEFLNMLYGTENEDYGMTKADVRNILKDHIKSLENLYNVIEDLDNTDNIEDLYNLGDTINLVEEIRKNIEFEREEN